MGWKKTLDVHSEEHAEITIMYVVIYYLHLILYVPPVFIKIKVSHLETDGKIERTG